MNEPNMSRAKGDGVGIQLAEWPGNGETVLCIHGLTGNCRSFDVIADTLSPPHHVLAVDLRGRGLSDKPDTGYSIDHHLRDLNAVAEDRSLEKFFIMGHSLGSYISLAFAAAYPERIKGVILIDGGADLTLEQWANVSAGIKPSLERLGQIFPSFEAYVEIMKLAPFLQPWSEVLDNYFLYESEELPGGMRRSRIQPQHINEERSNLLNLKPSELYPKIHCPVLILRAPQPMLTDKDLVLPEDALPGFLKALPQARLVNVEGVNHYSIVLHPSPDLDQALKEFLGG